MRLVVAITHYYHPEGGEYGSLGSDPEPRVAALRESILALHRLFGPRQYLLKHDTRVAEPVNDALRAEALDVVVCTTGGRHLLDRLGLPAGMARHVQTSADPRLLGYECHAVLRDALGDFDWYGYLEDDILVEDPWYFRKLGWFRSTFGDDVLLQPNRYEAGADLPAFKLYIDGDLDVSKLAPLGLEFGPPLEAEWAGAPVHFVATRNPHAGSFFLSREQMGRWAAAPYFLDRSSDFVGPLESAATLGIARTFRVYKPAAEDAAFLEVRHHGEGMMHHLGAAVRMPEEPVAAAAPVATAAPSPDGESASAPAESGARGFVLWLTGLPAAGKTTLARALESHVAGDGRRVVVLDGDEIRTRWPELGFSKKDRDENVRRVGELAAADAAAGATVIVALVSPYRRARAEARAAAGAFVEVYVKCPGEVREARDPKGLYKRARAGEITGVTGVDDPYEEPLAPEVVVNSHFEDPETGAARVLRRLEDLGYLEKTGADA